MFSTSECPPFDPAVFAGDYAEARAKFLTAASVAGANVRNYPHPLKGMQGEALATDVALLGNPDASSMLVLVSATHGVEGFCGSAAQVDFLRIARALPESVAVLLVHAINPHGFSWLRRVTEDGIDLNRNYIDFNEPFPENPGYEELADAILPAELSGQAMQEANARLAAFEARYGRVAYEEALSSGQYTHPDGLFYGGTAPTWSCLTSEAIMHDYHLAARQHVGLLDFHTGLGPFGYGEPICDHPPGSRAVKLARDWYGDSVTEPALGTSCSVVKFGLSDFGWQRRIGEPLLFIALEFGTYDVNDLMYVLRADHWLHRHGTPDLFSDQARAVKAAIRRHFYPETSEWQQMVISRSRECIGQALDGLLRSQGSADLLASP